MWLLPILSTISTAAARTYYRLRVSGEAVPRRGPLLLVANHPNALLDPALVAVAARRPVRFLAKAPLLEDRRVGWLVRGAGAIPVYRRSDDPAAMGRNVDMFRAVTEALEGGSAIGIFPEGTSHSEPSLATLRTGAARIALGTYAQCRETFPIHPVGLVLRRKDVFRSQAAVVVGPEVSWKDLAGRGPEDHAAVRELTERIEGSLRRVTLNLESWEDRPLVECAEAIWSTEFSPRGAVHDRLARLEVVTRHLSRLRRLEDPGALALARDLRHYCRRLDRLGLQPADLVTDLRLQQSLRWTLRRLYLLGPPSLAAAVVGLLLFWIPYRLTGVVAGRLPGTVDVRSTYKLLAGILFYGLWTLTLVATAAGLGGIAWAGGVLVVVPATGVVGLWVRERWRGAWTDARKFVLLRSRRRLVDGLRQRQHELAQRLREVYQELENGGRPV